MAVMLAENNMSPNEALKHFKVALQHARKAKETLYEMNVLLSIALLQEQLQDYEGAAQALKEALRHDPENQKIRQKMQQLELM